MRDYLDSRRHLAARSLPPDASQAEIDQYIRQQMAKGMGYQLSLALQAAEDGKLWVRDRSWALPALEGLGLIELRGDFWHLTPLGETLMAEWRQNARRL